MQTCTIKDTQTCTIKGTQTCTIKGTQTCTIKGTQTCTIKDTQTCKIKDTQTCRSTIQCLKLCCSLGSRWLQCRHPLTVTHPSWNRYLDRRAIRQNHLRPSKSAEWQLSSDLHVSRLVWPIHICVGFVLIFRDNC